MLQTAYPTPRITPPFPELYKRVERHIPPFEWANGHAPNDIAPKQHIKITEPGLIVRLQGGKLVGSMTTWAWKEARASNF